MIERYYKEIRVEFERQKVHIYARKPVYDFLEQKSKKDALVLSEYILREYKKLYGRELKISRDSLAIEILGHVYLDHFADLAKMLKSSPLKALLQEMKSRTEVIDCGERSVDSNRYVWDDLEPYKKTIYVLCGKHA